MKCDIIIPIWNQPEFTKECIKNIFRNTDYPYRLILIDNASDYDTKRYLEELASSAQCETILIRNNVNAGFIKAVNQGLKESSSPYVCVLNNDTVTSPGWLKRMIQFAKSHKDVGLINPQCNGHADMPIEQYAKTLERNEGIYMEMSQCQGFAMLIKRELIDKIGYLDESFGIGGYDDTDYSMRAHKAGYKSVCIYDAYVYHRLHASFDKAGNREEWVKRNKKIYYDKWGKHLRVGIWSWLGDGDADVLSGLVKYAYGLAREWAWVHLWLSSNIDTDELKRRIGRAIKSNGYPLHQNIRIQYFRVPGFILRIIVFIKVLERINPRMREKRFNAVCEFRAEGRLCEDWENKGKELAMSLAGNKKQL